MSISPLMLEAATVDSWNAMHRESPLKAYANMLANSPETLAAHKKNVEALLQTGCDPDKAIRKLTQGRQGLEDCIDSAKAFHKRLAAYLKVWAAAKKIEAT